LNAIIFLSVIVIIITIFRKKNKPKKLANRFILSK